MRRLHALGLLTSVALDGCVVTPYPLYPGGTRRSDDEVGVLVGPIAVVDGQDVASKGQTFALLPGCHTFRLQPTTGDASNAGGYVASLPQGTFGIAIEPGHSYTFEATLHQYGAAVSSGTIGFTDRARNGAVTPARGCNG